MYYISLKRWMKSPEKAFVKVYLDKRKVILVGILSVYLFLYSLSLPFIDDGVLSKMSSSPTLEKGESLVHTAEDKNGIWSMV